VGVDYLVVSGMSKKDREVLDYFIALGLFTLLILIGVLDRFVW